jgi:hypothetical protein
MHRNHQAVPPSLRPAHPTLYPRLRFSLVSLFLLFALSTLSALRMPPSVDSDGDYKADVATSHPPQELAGPIRDSLSPNAVRVSNANGTFCQIWLRPNVPPATTMNRDTGVVFGQIAEGTLIGAVRLESAATDYHNQSIKPGVYTLRYYLQPVNAEHTGVSPFRDFLLLVPAGVDLTPARLTGDDLLNASRKASGTDHPSVWSLLPDNAAPVTLPSTRHADPGDFWVLYFRAGVPSAAGNPAPAVMGLILVGHAPIS